MVDTKPNGVRSTHERDAATALLDRKLKIAESLTCRDLFPELEAIDAEIDRRARERLTIDQRLVAAQAQAADAEALVLLGIEGKNETERKAHRAQLLRDDPIYQQCAATVRELERLRQEADIDTESLRRRARRIERNVDYRTAALRMIGG